MSREARGVALGGYTLLSLILILAWPAVADRAFQWLSQAEPPGPSDLLVVVTGGARERLVTAFRLYRDGYAPAILVTGPPGAPERALAGFASEGLPAAALVSPGSPSESTVEDAMRIREVVLRRGSRSILVVTSPYHCRRVRLVLERALADLDVRIAVTASGSLYMDTRRWWADRQGWNLIPAEYLKLAWAWATVPSARGGEMTGTP